MWTLTFAGTTVRLPDAKRLHDLATLLARPGRDISSAELIGASVVEPDTGPASTCRPAAATSAASSSCRPSSSTPRTRTTRAARTRPGWRWTISSSSSPPPPGWPAGPGAAAAPASAPGRPSAGGSARRSPASPRCIRSWAPPSRRGARGRLVQLPARAGGALGAVRPDLTAASTGMGALIRTDEGAPALPRARLRPRCPTPTSAQSCSNTANPIPSCRSRTRGPWPGRDDHPRLPDEGRGRARALACRDDIRGDRTSAHLRRRAGLDGARRRHHRRAGRGAARRHRGRHRRHASRCPRQVQTRRPGSPPWSPHPGAPWPSWQAASPSCRRGSPSEGVADR